LRRGRPAAGLRWISPDKPGYGASDYHRERTLLSWGDDLASLAGRLGLERFSLAGESGGGPFTLAAAWKLAGRVSVAALIATGGPFSPAERADMKTDNRVMTWLAMNAPALNSIRIGVMRRTVVSPARRDRALRRELAAMPPATHADVR